MNDLKWILTGCALIALGCDGDGGAADAGPRGGDGAVADCDPEGETVRGEVDADTTWSCGLYVLDGPVFVTNGATLTIEAGAEILGETGGAAAASLIVTRGARLVAEGSASAPIVFTSWNPAGARATGDWAGVALLGAASTNDGECVDGTGDACAGGHLQDRLEGIDPADPRGLYGGTDDASSCGTLRYVRVEFAGRELSPDNELNGLTLGACGSGTTLSYVQVHRGKDDGIELFGGTASLDHVVVSGAADDSLDFDEGWRGNGQFIVLHQFPGIGDRGIEADNFGSNELATPTTRPNLWNLTLIGTSEHKAALFREGTQGIFGNVLVSGHGAPPDVHASVADPNAARPADFRFTHGLFHAVGDFPAEDLTIAEFWAEADRIAGGALDDTPPADLRSVLRALDRAESERIMTREQASRIGALLSSSLDDDFGFDERAEMSAASATFDVDPQLGSTSSTAPSYLPGNPAMPAGATPVFNANAPAGFGDPSATFIGAFDGSTDWTAGWTAYPEI